MWLKANNVTQMNLEQLDLLVKPLAMQDHRIAVMLSDISFMDMTVNMHLSLRRVSEINLLTVAFSEDTCNLYRKVGMHCLVYFNYNIGSILSDFSSDGFKQKVTLRNILLHDLVHLGYNVLLIDADIFFLHDPVDLLPKHDNSWHMAGIEVGTGVNGGLIFYNSGSITKAYFKNLCLLSKLAPRHDQYASHAVLDNREKFGNVTDSLRLLKISRNHALFLCFMPDSTNGHFDGDRSNKVFAHTTCVITLEAKIHVFKESNMWLNDRNGYYSNNRKKYLAFDNTFSRSLSLGEGKVVIKECDVFF